jgi:hypothetical protein
MTKTFEHFLRSFDDDELVSFAQTRAALHPPYWRVMRLALRVEADRRGIRLDHESATGGVTTEDTVARREPT